MLEEKHQQGTCGCKFYLFAMSILTGADHMPINQHFLSFKESNLQGSGHTAIPMMDISF